MSDSPSAVPEFNPEDEQSILETTEKAFAKPPRKFRDIVMKPYSRGTRLLYGIIQSDNDSVIYRALAFVYIHTHTREEMVNLCWDLPAFRVAITNFRDVITEPEEADCLKMVEEILSEERATEVGPITSAKKNEETSSPATPPTSSPPSAPS